MPIRSSPEVLTISINEVILRISVLTSNLVSFWSRAEGWAPIEAAQLLTKARLDWQVSLSNCLAIWIEVPSPRAATGSQILAYATLGALVEGAMKLFLSVWYKDYGSDVEAIRKRGNLLDPETLCLEQLRGFFKKRVWGDAWDPWVLRIQQRRNAIHAFKHRQIGDHGELIEDIARYLSFLRYVNSRLPYPDDIYVPLER